MQWEADPRQFLMVVGLSFVARVLPFVAALFARATITATAEGADVQAVVNAAIVGIGVAVSLASARANVRCATVLVEKSIAHYDREILRFSTEIPVIEHLENPDYLDRLEQIRYQPTTLGGSGNVVTQVPWMLAQAALIVFLLAGIDPILLFLPVVALVSGRAVLRSQELQHRGFEVSAEHRRLANGFYEVAVSVERADEVRTLGVHR
jgi:hypothetical protein